MSYKEKIRTQYNSLTRRQKKVAEHLLANPYTVAMEPIATLSEKIGVSVTTIMRLCYTLEYSGYSELQKELQKEILAEKSMLTHHQETAQNLGSTLSLLNDVMERNIGHIRQTFEHIKIEDFDHAIEKLLQAKRIVTVGARGSLPAAEWFAYTLNMIIGNTKAYHPGKDDVIDLISEVNGDWVIVAFSLQRYAKETVDFVQMVKEEGAFVIAITDNLIAPISQNSHIVLPIHFPGRQAIEVEITTTLYALLHALLSGIAAKESQRVANRLTKHEEYYQKNKEVITY